MADISADACVDRSRCPERSRHTRRLIALGCLVLCAAALATPATAGAETLGSISGHVSEAMTHLPLQGIEVCAYAAKAEPSGEGEVEHTMGCATTDASGSYTVVELRGESYFVEFGGGIDKRNFITQYYNHKQKPGEATAVIVNPGTSTPGIDAELSPGAQIAGRMTDASTGAPIARGLVIAATPGSGEGFEPIALAVTGANGEYTLSGLPTGSYVVAFGAPRYTSTYFNQKANASEANLVSVTVPNLTSGIDGALSPRPTIPLLGESGSPSGAQLPGSGAGPAAGAGEGRLSLPGKRIAVARGVARVKLRCIGGASCHTRLSLVLRRTTGKRRHRIRSITIGVLTISLANGSRATVRIKLSRTGRRMLRARNGRMSVELAFAAAGATRYVRAVLVGPARRRAPAPSPGDAADP